MRLIGGPSVTGFKPVTDKAILNRLNSKAHGQVFQADLRAQGIQDYGHLKEQGALAQTKPNEPWPAMELSFKGKIMTLARWPNEGFARIDQLWPPELETAVEPKHMQPGECMAFRYVGDQPGRWVDEQDPWTHGYHGCDWDDWHIKIESIDPEKHIITLRFSHKSQEKSVPFYIDINRHLGNL